MAEGHRRLSRPGAMTVAELTNRVASAGQDPSSGDVTVPALVRRETALAKGWSSAGVTHRVAAPSAAVRSKLLALYAAAVGAAFCGSLASAEPLTDAVFSGDAPGSEIMAGLQVRENEVPRSPAPLTQTMAVPGEGMVAAAPTSAQPRPVRQQNSVPTTTSAPAQPPPPATTVAPASGASDARSRSEPEAAPQDRGEQPPQDGGGQPPQDGGEQPANSADDSGDPGGRPGGGDQAPSGDGEPDYDGGDGEPGAGGGDRADHGGDGGSGEGGDGDSGGRHRAEDDDGEQGGRHRAEDRSADAENRSANAEDRGGNAEDRG